MDAVLTPSKVFTGMKRVFLLVLTCIACIIFKSFGQQVAISSYLNKMDQRDEWTELIVLADDVDMRGWTIRDNSASNNWQTAITFNNIAFWNHIRIGTIIILWHRQKTSSGVNHPKDIKKTDGYLELYAFDPVYFSGGDINFSLNLAQNTDIIQLRDASGMHVHALAHGSPDLGSFTALPAPKVSYLSNAVIDGDVVIVTPGTNLSSYGTPPNNFANRNSSFYTFGLANTGANQTYWRSIREPQIAGQIVNPSSIVAGMPGSVSFSWTGATDPYNTDTTIRYLILRNTSNVFAPSPTDGITYPIGATFGSAIVVGIITNSATTSFTDNTVMNGNLYYYRVFAYRYDVDDLSGNGIGSERGSAYNIVNFVQVLWPNTSPLPIQLVHFNAELNSEQVSVSWTTASERNNSFFTVEKSPDGEHFKSVGTVKGNNNSTILINYELIDKSPYKGKSYYRLKQSDFDGQFSFSKLVAVYNGKEKANDFTIYPNPADDVLHLWFELKSEEELNYHVFDLQGKVILSKSISALPGSNIFDISLDKFAQGIYFLQLTGNSIQKNIKFIKQ